MLKRLPILLLIMTLVASFAIISVDNDQIAMAAAYVGAITTGKFHYTSCQWANRIRSENRVYFNSRQEAVNAGYIPCKVCRP